MKPLEAVQAYHGVLRDKDIPPVRALEDETARSRGGGAEAEPRQPRRRPDWVELIRLPVNSLWGGGRALGRVDAQNG